MPFLVNDHINKTEWRKFLLENTHASPYQSPEFFELINASKNNRAFAFANSNDETITAICVVVVQEEPGLKKHFSRRGIIFGGPMFSTANHNEAKIFLDKIEEILIKKGIIYLETRNLSDYSCFSSVYLKSGWTFVEYLNFEININGKNLNELIAAMKYNRKREINISLKEGATYRTANSKEDINALYGILSSLYIKRVKLPLPGLDYFHNLFSSKIGRVFIVEHNNKVIGGSFCYILPRKSIYTLYYCGLRDYNKKIFPTHLAILAALDFGVKEGLKTLDLMGAGKPGVEYGVRKYKAEFGGEQVQYGRFLKVLRPQLYSLGKLGLKILKLVKN